LISTSSFYQNTRLSQLELTRPSSFDQCEIVVGVIGKDGGPAQDWHIVIGALGVQSSQSGESLRHGFHRVAFGVEQWHPFELSVPFSVSTLNRA
jgi:hypothetical protein